MRFKIIDYPLIWVLIVAIFGGICFILNPTTIYGKDRGEPPILPIAESRFVLPDRPLSIGWGQYLWIFQEKIEYLKYPIVKPETKNLWDKILQRKRGEIDNENNRF